MSTIAIHPRITSPRDRTVYRVYLSTGPVPHTIFNRQAAGILGFYAHASGQSEDLHHTSLHHPTNQLQHVTSRHMHRRYRPAKPTRVQPSLEEGEYLMALEIAQYRAKYGSTMATRSSASMSYSQIGVLEGRLSLSTSGSKTKSMSVDTTFVAIADSSLASSKSSTWDAQLPTTLWPRGTSSPLHRGLSRTSLCIPPFMLFESDLDLSTARDIQTSTAVLPAHVSELPPRHPLAVYHRPKTFSLKLPARVALPRLPVPRKAEHTTDISEQDRLAKPVPHQQYSARKTKVDAPAVQLAKVSLGDQVTPPKLQEPLLLRRRGTYVRCLTVTIPEPKDKFRAMWAVSETAAVA